MPRALVVHESVSANAEQIAFAVAEGVARFCPVDISEACEAPRVLGDDLRLLIVGSTMQSASPPQRCPDACCTNEATSCVIDRSDGLRGWLLAVCVPPGLNAVAFDTRADRMKLVRGSTCTLAVERLLYQIGVNLVTHGEEFVAAASNGPLKVAEETRARQWGLSVGRLAV